jgi:heptosyltransferase-2
MVLDAQQMEILNRRILVLQTAFLGDAILSLPFLQELSKKNPDSQIDVITIPGCVEIFAACPAVSNVFVLDKHGAHKSLFTTLAFAKRFSPRNYSALYSLHRSLRSTLFARATGIPETFGFDTSALSFLYRHKIIYHREQHEVQRLLAFLQDETLLASWQVLPDMWLTAKQKEFVAEILSPVNRNKRWIAVAPGSVWQTKRYPELFFKRIIDYFSDGGYEILLLGGKAEADLCETFCTRDGVYNFAGKVSIVESKLIVEQSALLLTNDSATTHVGMAANAKTLTIYCSTVPSIGFYPYNEGSAWIGKDDLPCKPCGIHGHRACPEKHFKCGLELFPETIICKMENMLASE